MNFTFIEKTMATRVDLFVREELTKAELRWQLKTDAFVCVSSNVRITSQELMQIVGLPNLLLSTPMQLLDLTRCQQHTYIIPRLWALPF